LVAAVFGVMAVLAAVGVAGLWDAHVTEWRQRRTRA
jgi:ABC-type phosphate transport system auxiliary subunit